MAVAMTDDPMMGLGVQLGKVGDAAGFNQAIDVFAFLQGHVPASARRNFGQQRTAAIDLSAAVAQVEITPAQFYIHFQQHADLYHKGMGIYTTFLRNKNNGLH